MWHIFESLLTMEGRGRSGSWACASSTRAKAQQASIVQPFIHVQVEVEVHDEQVAQVNGYEAKPQESEFGKTRGLKARPIEMRFLHPAKTMRH